MNKVLAGHYSMGALQRFHECRCDTIRVYAHENFLIFLLSFLINSYYLSISPITISIDPRMAMRSEIMTPREISGMTERLEKHGERPLHLKGIS
jgi:hypothetical protein